MKDDNLLSTAMPRRLNVGCGYDKRAGYLNVDLQPKHEPDMVADATHLPELPSDYFEEILAQDVLEHFERSRTEPALAEWSRLLAPEGILELRVPSLLGMFEMLATPHYRGFDGAQQIVHLMYGTQAYTGDFHLTGFTPALLHGYLRNAGLLVCHAQVMHGWLFDVRARKTAHLTDDIEFLHSAYFDILHRPADPQGIEIHARALKGGVTRADIEARLRNSEEAQFLATNPSYLWQHAGYGGKQSPLASVSRKLRALARSLRSRVVRS
jgi:predicted SAM-dependent methyltransferase